MWISKVNLTYPHFLILNLYFFLTNETVLLLFTRFIFINQTPLSDIYDFTFLSLRYLLAKC